MKEKLKLIWKICLHTNAYLLIYSGIDLVLAIGVFMTTGLWYWVLFSIQCIYFLFFLWIHIKYQLSSHNLNNFIWDSPISLVIGKLGTGKTLFLAYLSEVMKHKAEHVYSNFPVDDKHTKLLTFNNLDFTNRTKLVPPDDSLILFDESYLYVDGTSPHDEKVTHSGKIPWIVLARHFRNRAVFTAQRSGMLWNNIRELSSCLIIPLKLRKPKIKKKGLNLFNRFFIMKLGIFQDIDSYEIWKNKSTERLADGKRVKQKSDDGIGIHFFKIIIPLEYVEKYDSHWLNFVRDLKNDEISNKREYHWFEIQNLDNKEKLKLFDIDILKKNLQKKSTEKPTWKKAKEKK